MMTLLSILAIFIVGFVVGFQYAYIRAYDACIDRLSKIVTRMENLKK